MPWHLAHSLLCSVSLVPSNKLLESCPFGHILECRGVASAVPITIDKIEVNLDFHIFDVLDLDLLIGFPLDNLHHTALGSLHEHIRKTTFAIPCLENPLAKPFPKQNSLEMIVQTSTSKIEFELHPTIPHCVVLDHDRDTTTIFHDEPLAIENHWAMESSEALPLECEEKGSINEHDIFILESPPPCSISTPPELATCCTTNAFVRCNLLALPSKMFRRMVVDTFVYHKHCKFRGCTIALTL